MNSKVGENIEREVVKLPISEPSVALNPFTDGMVHISENSAIPRGESLAI